MNNQHTPQESIEPSTNNEFILQIPQSSLPHESHNFPQSTSVLQFDPSEIILDTSISSTSQSLSTMPNSNINHTIPPLLDTFLPFNSLQQGQVPSFSPNPITLHHNQQLNQTDPNQTIQLAGAVDDGDYHTPPPSVIASPQLLRSVHPKTPKKPESMHHLIGINPIPLKLSNGGSNDENINAISTSISPDLTLSTFNTENIEPLQSSSRSSTPYVHPYSTLGQHNKHNSSFHHRYAKYLSPFTNKTSNPSSCAVLNTLAMLESIEKEITSVDLQFNLDSSSTSSTSTVTPPFTSIFTSSPTVSSLPRPFNSTTPPFLPLSTTTPPLDITFLDPLLYSEFSGLATQPKSQQPVPFPKLSSFDLKSKNPPDEILEQTIQDYFTQDTDFTPLSAKDVLIKRDQIAYLESISQLFFTQPKSLSHSIISIPTRIEYQKFRHSYDNLPVTKDYRVFLNFDQVCEITKLLPFFYPHLNQQLVQFLKLSSQKVQSTHSMNNGSGDLDLQQEQLEDTQISPFNISNDTLEVGLSPFILQLLHHIPGYYSPTQLHQQIFSPSTQMTPQSQNITLIPASLTSNTTPTSTRPSTTPLTFPLNSPHDTSSRTLQQSLTQFNHSSPYLSFQSLLPQHSQIDFQLMQHTLSLIISQQSAFNFARHINQREANGESLDNIFKPQPDHIHTPLNSTLDKVSSPTQFPTPKITIHTPPAAKKRSWNQLSFDDDDIGSGLQKHGIYQQFHNDNNNNNNNNNDHNNENAEYVSLIPSITLSHLPLSTDQAIPHLIPDNYSQSDQRKAQKEKLSSPNSPHPNSQSQPHSQSTSISTQISLNTSTTSTTTSAILNPIPITEFAPQCGDLLFILLCPILYAYFLSIHIPLSVPSLSSPSSSETLHTTNHTMQGPVYYEFPLYLPFFGSHTMIVHFIAPKPICSSSPTQILSNLSVNSSTSSHTIQIPDLEPQDSTSLSISNLVKPPFESIIQINSTAQQNDLSKLSPTTDFSSHSKPSTNSTLNNTFYSNNNNSPIQGLPEIVTTKMFASPLDCSTSIDRCTSSRSQTGLDAFFNTTQSMPFISLSLVPFGGSNPNSSSLTPSASAFGSWDSKVGQGILLDSTNNAIVKTKRIIPTHRFSSRQSASVESSCENDQITKSSRNITQDTATGTITPVRITSPSRLHVSNSSQSGRNTPSTSLSHNRQTKTSSLKSSIPPPPLINNIIHRIVNTNTIWVIIMQLSALYKVWAIEQITCLIATKAILPPFLHQFKQNDLVNSLFEVDKKYQEDFKSRPIITLSPPQVRISPHKQFTSLSSTPIKGSLSSGSMRPISTPKPPIPLPLLPSSMCLSQKQKQKQQQQQRQGFPASAQSISFKKPPTISLFAQLHQAFLVEQINTNVFDQFIQIIRHYNHLFLATNSTLLVELQLQYSTHPERLLYYPSTATGTTPNTMAAHGFHNFPIPRNCSQHRSQLERLYALEHTSVLSNTPLLCSYCVEMKQQTQLHNSSTSNTSSEKYKLMTSPYDNQNDSLESLNNLSFLRVSQLGSHRNGSEFNFGPSLPTFMNSAFTIPFDMVLRNLQNKAPLIMNSHSTSNMNDDSDCSFNTSKNYEKNEYLCNNYPIFHTINHNISYNQFEQYFRSKNDEIQSNHASINKNNSMENFPHNDVDALEQQQIFHSCLSPCRCLDIFHFLCDFQGQPLHFGHDLQSTIEQHTFSDGSLELGFYVPGTQNSNPSNLPLEELNDPSLAVYASTRPIIDATKSSSSQPTHSCGLSSHQHDPNLNAPATTPASQKLSPLQQVILYSREFHNNYPNSTCPWCIPISRRKRAVLKELHEFIIKTSLSFTTRSYFPSPEPLYIPQSTSMDDTNITDDEIQSTYRETQSKPINSNSPHRTKRSKWNNNTSDTLNINFNRMDNEQSDNEDADGNVDDSATELTNTNGTFNQSRPSNQSQRIQTPTRTPQRTPIFGPLNSVSHVATDFHLSSVRNTPNRLQSAQTPYRPLLAAVINTPNRSLQPTGFKQSQETKLTSSVNKITSGTPSQYSFPSAQHGTSSVSKYAHIRNSSNNSQRPIQTNTEDRFSRINGIKPLHLDQDDAMSTTVLNDATNINTMTQELANSDNDGEEEGREIGMSTPPTTRHKLPSSLMQINSNSGHLFQSTSSSATTRSPLKLQSQQNVQFQDRQRTMSTPPIRKAQSTTNSNTIQLSNTAFDDINVSFDEKTPQTPHSPPQDALLDDCLEYMTPVLIYSFLEKSIQLQQSPQVNLIDDNGDRIMGDTSENETPVTPTTTQ